MSRSCGELQGPDVPGPAHAPGWTQRAPHRLQEGGVFNLQASLIIFVETGNDRRFLEFTGIIKGFPFSVFCPVFPFLIFYFLICSHTHAQMFLFYLFSFFFFFYFVFLTPG